MAGADNEVYPTLQDKQTILRNVKDLFWDSDHPLPRVFDLISDIHTFPLINTVSGPIAVVYKCGSSSRLIAFGSEHFVTENFVLKNRVFYQNVILWLLRWWGPFRIGVLNCPGLAACLRQQFGYNAEDIERVSSINLQNVNIAIIAGGLNDNEAIKVVDFVKSGGAVILAADLRQHGIHGGFKLTDKIGYRTSSNGYVATVRDKSWMKCSEEILEGVKEITWKGGSIPGSLCLFGENAFRLVLGKNNGPLEPAIVGSCLDNGLKIVAFGHDGFLLSSDMWDHGDNKRFHTNIIRWMGKSEKSLVRVYDPSKSGLENRIRQLGFEVNSLTNPEGLTGNEIVYYASTDVEPLLPLVQNGSRNLTGGIILAATGWGWAQTHPGLELSRDFAGNKLGKLCGFAWTDNTLDSSDKRFWVNYAKVNSRPIIRPFPRPNILKKAVHAIDAWENALLYRGDRWAQWDPVQSSHTLTTCVRFASSDSFVSYLPVDVACAEMPLRKDDVLGRLLAVNQFVKMKERGIMGDGPHPLSNNFPGTVQSSIASNTVYLNGNQWFTKWHCTGIYAPPGIVITITIRPEFKGLKVQVGSHTDTLWHLDEWKRFPEISRSFDLKGPSTRVSNPFGGLVYIDLPAGTPALEVQVDGGCLAPVYKLGETSDSDWIERIRFLRAPFGEIGSSKFILTLPYDVISEVTNPREVCEFWDTVLDAMADLAGIPKNRPYPERMVFDVQISCGYLHSGYPIMGPLSLAKSSVDVGTLRREGDWGFFHELGHNHQESTWTFDGTTEVTVNLFTLYVFDQIVGISVDKHPRGDEKFRRGHMERYNLLNPAFEEWKCDPFLALVMYEQIILQFGWDLIKSVFAEYRTLGDHEKPKSDFEKREQWMRRLSQRAGVNLEPFFRAWGVYDGAQQCECLNEFPKWYCWDFECLEPQCRPNKC